MPDGTIMAASAMAGLEHELEMTAKNLANARTPGFHPRVTSTKSFESELDDSGAKLVNTRETISFEKGVVVPDAGNPLAVAVDGDGFFEIDTPGGPAFTRNGDFTLDADGTVVTRVGYPVRGEGGPIRAVPGGGEIKVEPSGAIKQGSSEIGRLRLVDFAKKDALEPVSDTLFRAGPGVTPKPVDHPQVKPQSLEYADETAVTSLVDLIRIHRHFDAAQHVLNSINETYTQRIRSLG